MLPDGRSKRCVNHLIRALLENFIIEPMCCANSLNMSVLDLHRQRVDRLV